MKKIKRSPTPGVFIGISWFHSSHDLIVSYLNSYSNYSIVHYVSLRFLNSGRVVFFLSLNFYNTAARYIYTYSIIQYYIYVKFSQSLSNLICKTVSCICFICKKKYKYWHTHQYKPPNHLDFLEIKTIGIKIVDHDAITAFTCFSRYTTN